MKKLAIYLAIISVLAAVAGIVLDRIEKAWAGVACSVPFTFVNGTVADATQVNSNFNSVTTCLLNAASAGVNSDITVIAGLTTPLAPAEGGSQTYTATATSTGTANAQIIAATTPIGFTLTTGKKVRFVAGFSNTGSTTLTVAGTVTTTFARQTQTGPAGMVGGEIISGQMVEAIFDGTNYQMTSPPALNLPVGAVFDYAGGAGCPVGSASALGGNLVTSTFPTLSAVLGISWGNPGGGNFTLPDLRGRTLYGIDNGAARITVAGGNFDGTVFANTGGLQNQTLTLAQLPATPAPVSVTGSVTPTVGGGNSEIGVPSAAGASSTTGPGAFSTYSTAAYQSQDTKTVTSTTNTLNLGSGNAHPVLSNGAIVFKCVKE